MYNWLQVRLLQQVCATARAAVCSRFNLCEAIVRAAVSTGAQPVRAASASSRCSWCAASACSGCRREMSDGATAAAGTDTSHSGGEMDAVLLGRTRDLKVWTGLLVRCNLNRLVHHRHLKLMLRGDLMWWTLTMFVISECFDIEGYTTRPLDGSSVFVSVASNRTSVVISVVNYLRLQHVTWTSSLPGVRKLYVLYLCC